MPKKIHFFYIIINLVFIFLLYPIKIFAFHVVIDPGHGGSDTGATRADFRESDLTLKLGLKIQSLMLENFPDIQISLTRVEDLNLTLEQRVDLAQKSKADLFISLHANSSPAKYVSGMEFYFKKGLNTDPAITLLENIRSQKNINISNDISKRQQDVVKTITSDLIDWGQTKQSLSFNKILQNHAQMSKSLIKRAPFFVIENLAIPSVLIEIGYITNLSESKKLFSDEYQIQIAHSIVRSINDFKLKFYSSESK